MPNKIYRTLKPIQRIENKYNFLGGEIKINNGITNYFIPICSIDLEQSGKATMSLTFDTLDVHTGNISHNDYQEFLSYCKALSYHDFNNFHRIVNNKFNRYIDYVSGEFVLPIGAIRKDFTLAKKRYTTLKILSKDDHTIILLFSPDTDKAWVSRLGIKRQKLSQHNLKSILYLLTNHLFNQINSINIRNNNFNIFRYVTPRTVIIKNHYLILKTIFGELKLKLNKYKAYFETPLNKNPRLKFIYNNHNEIDLIMKSKKYTNLVNLLTQQ